MRYDYTPEPNRKTGLALSFCGFISSMILLVIRTDEAFFGSILFSISILLFFVGACVFFRFVMTTFTYSIESGYGGEDLVIFCRTGKKTRTVLRVSFDSFVCICESNDKNSETEKQKSKTKNYFYCSDIFGKDRYYLYLYDEGRLCRVKFCPDKTIVRVISEECKVNRRRNLT